MLIIGLIKIINPDKAIFSTFIFQGPLYTLSCSFCFLLVSKLILIVTFKSKKRYYYWLFSNFLYLFDQFRCNGYNIFVLLSLTLMTYPVLFLFLVCSYFFIREITITCDFSTLTATILTDRYG